LRALEHYFDHTGPLKVPFNGNFVFICHVTVSKWLIIMELMMVCGWLDQYLDNLTPEMALFMRSYREHCCKNPVIFR
jgi:hypothetical protein